MNKLWLSFLTVFFLMLGLHPLQAQATLPPIPDSAQFLADGVTLIESKPILNSDDSTRTFFYFNGTTWKTYPYPDGFASVGGNTSLDPRSDGTYVLRDHSFLTFHRDDVAHIWIFDPHSETFIHPKAACGFIKALHGEGKWLLYRASINAPFSLCFSETGEIKPISVDLHPESCSDFELPNDPILSPDGAWLIFSDCGIAPQLISLYAYHLAKAQLISLGTVAREYWNGESIEADRWIDNTHPVLYISAYHTTATYNVLIADLAQANSLYLIVDMVDQWPLAFPDHLEWFPSSSSGMPGPNQPGYCQLNRFDLKTETLTVLPEISGVCNGLPILDGTGDYLDVSFGDWKAGKSSLLRFNPLTGQKRDLLDGEIEWLQSISPDGHYALIIMDNNGKLQYGYYWEPEQYSWDQDPTAWTAIFDLQTGKVIYTVPGVANVYYGYSPYIEWLDADRILVSTDGSAEFKPLTGVSIVDLRDLVSETPIEGGVHDLGGNRLLIHQDSGSDSQISLYDISTRKLQPITYLWNSKQYAVRISPHGADFEMTITNPAQSITLADWLIRVS